jgi:transcriptional regulator with XRE-family HTH domain
MVRPATFRQAHSPIARHRAARPPCQKSKFCATSVLRTEQKHAKIIAVSTSARALFEEPGRRLRHLRERLCLRYRDVEEASQRIAARHGNDEFLIGLSRLADIENKGTVPTIYRLYSLCAIYGLDFATALDWYGVELASLASDAAKLPLRATRPLDFQSTNLPELKLASDLTSPLDLRKTLYLPRHIHGWGKLPVALLDGLDLRRQRYAFIGTDDWTMHPIIAPGSFIQIDESKRRVAKEGWAHEQERPIYFLEHRNGYACGWCTEKNGLLVLQPHPLSQAQLEIFRYPGEVDVIGQVVGVAMRLDQARRRRTRS